MTGLCAGIAAAAGLGAVVETAAWAARLWVYRKPVYRVANVAGMVGFDMSPVASLAARLGRAGVFAVGFASGLAYEFLNLAWGKWWAFPGDALWFLRGRVACAVGVSLAWGAVPVTVALWMGGG